PAAAAPAPAPAIPQPAAPPAASAAAPRAVADGSEAITAPIMGRFFAKPDPASPPFVTVGSEVEEGTTVALIEVMKVFNAVQAGMRGVITEICVADAELVEYGQPMFRVRPVA
ncbi:acetyl-CoA carboxylase biotin carboxyl carrier protein, partial [Propylenella binzhouense]